MNGTTKNDLCARTVTLDLDALIKTAAYATEELNQQCRRYIDDQSNATRRNDITLIYLSGERLRDTAKQLAIAADTYAALLGTADREEVKILR